MSNSTVMQPHVRVLQHVPRWGIIRTLRQQSVAEHSYYVTLYAAYIAQKMEVSEDDRTYILEHALTHDFDEMVSGDLPTPYKHSITESQHTQKILSAPKSMQLSIITTNPDDLQMCNRIIKLADVYEACMYLSDEVTMGNGTVRDLYAEIHMEFTTRLTNLIGKDYGSSELWLEMQHNLNQKKTRLLTHNGLE